MYRDAPLVSIEIFYKARVENIPKQTGINFPTTSFYYKNGAYIYYWDIEPFQSELPIAFSKWLKENKDLVSSIYERLQVALEYCRNIDIKNLKSLDDYIQVLNKMKQLLLNGFLGNFVFQIIPLFYQRYKEKGELLFDQKIISQFIKWRNKKGSNFFNDTTETMYYILNGISKNTHFDRELLYLMRYEELIQFLKDKNDININELKKRKNNEFLFFDNKIIFEPEISSKLTEYGFYIEKDKISQMNIIKGNIAYKGNVKGIAKIIFNRNQIDKLKQGDILIAPMTSPWYLPSMQKAEAIVTDEGGITCHAAIIAREMNKPCVIGTKYATHVFKDGDLVEVDAYKGIVRKIKT